MYCMLVWSLIKFHVITFYILFRVGEVVNTQNNPLLWP